MPWVLVLLGELAVLISLSLSFPWLSSSLGSNSLALTTIHPLLQALISPLGWGSFCVGLDVELLLVTGYAWTPSLQRFVDVCGLGW